MLLVLCGFSTQQAWQLHPSSGVIVTLLLAAVFLALVQERRTLAQAEVRSLFSRPALLDFAGVVVGALVTYILSVDLALGAVTASGLIGLLASYSELLLAGVAVGLVYNLSATVLNGFGGKLGTIAFGASMATWAFRSLLVGGREDARAAERRNG